MPEQITTKSGRVVFRFSLEEIQEASENMEGFCIGCGTTRSSCEPDAREYDCDECGQLKVYGAEELALMGYVS